MKRVLYWNFCKSHLTSFYLPSLSLSRWFFSLLLLSLLSLLLSFSCWFSIVQFMNRPAVGKSMPFLFRCIFNPVYACTLHRVENANEKKLSLTHTLSDRLNLDALQWGCTWIIILCIWIGREMVLVFVWNFFHRASLFWQHQHTASTTQPTSFCHVQSFENAN